MKIEGSRVWLTGASSGIGYALARALALRGARVALFARNRERLERLRDEIVVAREGPDPGPEVILQTGDVTDRSRVLEAVREAEERLGGLELAIFSAGIGDSLPVERFDSEKVRQIFAVNVQGVVHGIEAVLPGFLRRRDGVLVGISSVAGYRGLPQSAPYCASKAALTTFLESLRLDLKSRGIRVLTVSPGFVKTPLTDRNRFPMPFLLRADRAAEIILRGIEKERREIHFPLRLTGFMKLLRVLPIGLYDLLVGLAMRGQRGRYKRGETPD